MAYQGTLGIERNRLVYALFLACAGLAILGSLLATPDDALWRGLHYLTKPTATLLLLVAVLRNSPASSRTYAAPVAVGLLFAAAGDTFLMLPGDYFLAGLICFLLTHCAYIFALTRDAKLAAHPGLFGTFSLVAFAVVAGLWTSLPPEMRIPVIIYALALGAMAAQAISRLRQFSGMPAQATARFAACGGLLFMISDTLLAYGRFRWQIPYNALWVLGTYYAAQYFFARSTEAYDNKR
ncbi:MAG TPA: lysoplasmalogenase [Ensifer sp.]|uniref:lysoplasmalogenase n=1 Tax=Ensifer sp. TaxID=1872086 RepID=UPI002E128CA5|nr:lysoplasmalogenase [Ensifer sp.]